MFNGLKLVKQEPNNGIQIAEQLYLISSLAMPSTVHIASTVKFAKHQSQLVFWVLFHEIINNYATVSEKTLPV